MCKSSVYFVVPPHFRLGPPHFVWSGNGTAVACCYLVPTVFMESKDRTFSNTSSNRNVFFAFSYLEIKIDLLQYIVASGNADCTLLFDGFSR